MSYETLLPQHRAMVHTSGVDPLVATDRGYRSITEPAELKALGFAGYQSNVPGLLIPISTVGGQVGTYQYRPDIPRKTEAGKPVKYETPDGSRLFLDVPHALLEQVKDPKSPLWITEGARKVDAALSRGLCCIGLSGVWGWRGTNKFGGKTALSDWDSVALNGREVLIAFDSDVMSKATVRAALERLDAFLQSRGARIRFVLLPEGADGEKVGLDDFFAGGGTVEQLGAYIVDRIPAQDDLPPYPTHAFPSLVARFIREAAAALGTTESMLGTPFLGFASAAIGNTRYVQVKRKYRQYPILWIALVAPPGSTKSPAIESAREPLAALQQGALDRWKQDMARYESDLADWNALGKTEKLSVSRPTQPQLEHFLTTDSTKEALAVMAAQSAGIAVYRDELVAWVASFDAYRSGRGGDRQDMLSLWSGTSLKIDRKGVQSISVARPNVSVIGGVQPDRLKSLAREAVQDGFLDRFLWDYPEVLAMTWTDSEVPHETEQVLVELFTKLRVELDADHSDGFAVELSSTARALFVDWHEENALLQEGASQVFRSIYAKLPLQLLRIALVLHCLAYPDKNANMLCAETIKGAIALVEFYRANAVKVMREMRQVDSPRGLELHQRIMRILRILGSKSEEGWVSRSDLLRGLGNVKVEDLNRELKLLLMEGMVERQTSPTSTNTAERWRLTQQPDASIDSKDSNNSLSSHTTEPLPNSSNPSNAQYGQFQERDDFNEEVIL